MQKGEWNTKVNKFNDEWGKSTVKQFLLNKGINENKIHDTGKFECVDLIINKSNKYIDIIEIKNRYGLQNLYKGLKMFGLKEDKWFAMKQKKKDLEKYHNKKVRMWYVNFNDTHMSCYELIEGEVEKLEIQTRLVSDFIGATTKSYHKFYQVPFSKSNNYKINEEKLNERQQFITDNR